MEVMKNCIYDKAINHNNVRTKGSVTHLLLVFACTREDIWLHVWLSTGELGFDIQQKILLHKCSGFYCTKCSDFGILVNNTAQSEWKWSLHLQAGLWRSQSELDIVLFVITPRPVLRPVHSLMQEMIGLSSPTPTPSCYPAELETNSPQASNTKVIRLTGMFTSTSSYIVMPWPD
jgi:hypothetical protein